VSNGRELVDAALAQRPDVIVSDLDMPSLDGLAAMKVLRDAGDTIPFVLLTAMEGDVRDWIDMGVIGVVLKSDLLGPGGGRRVRRSRADLSLPDLTSEM
jgi:CheY-like chemotaxis protein